MDDPYSLKLLHQRLYQHLQVEFHFAGLFSVMGINVLDSDDLRHVFGYADYSINVARQNFVDDFSRQELLYLYI